MTSDPLDRPMPMSGQESREYGAITTLENAAGRVLVLHRIGKVRDAVRAAYATAHALDETFRVVAVSTPVSIWTDLKGARQPIRNQHERNGSQRAPLPEHTTCGGKDRHMLHPRLRGTTKDAWRDAPR